MDTLDTMETPDYITILHSYANQIEHFLVHSTPDSMIVVKRVFHIINLFLRNYKMNTKEKEINTRILIYELLDFVDDVIPHLGSRHAINYVHKILEKGTGADQQLKVYQDTNSLVEVVDFIQKKFLDGL